MIIAINTLRNNKMFKSLQVHNDLSLQETENNRWIAPEYLIQDYGEEKKGSEIELIYMKPTSYIKNIGRNDIKIFKSSFFRNAKNKTGVIFKEPNKNHLRVQNFIFNYLLENKDSIRFKISNKIEQGLNTEFYYITLDELGPDFSSLDFEITLKDSDMKKRADIFLKINNKQEIFGKALCIEIQLSPQSYDKTDERTLHRAYLGMSTIWIKHKDLEIDEDCILLKTEDLEILPYLHVLNKANENATEIIRLEYERQGILIDNKIDGCKKFLKDFIILPVEYMLCPFCKIGQLIKKCGPYGFFLGCTNFKNANYNCKAKYEIKE